MPHRNLAPAFTKHVKEVTGINNAMLGRLAKNGCVTLPELGEILEDTANHLLNVAEEIRREIIASSRQAKCGSASMTEAGEGSRRGSDRN